MIFTIDERGDFLGLPHGTTQAAAIANKMQTFGHVDPLEAVKTFKRGIGDHIAQFRVLYPHKWAYINRRH